MNFMFIGALFGALAVTLGAFGAHALKKQFDDYQLSIWQTAVEYHFIHAVLLVLIGYFLKSSDGIWLKVSAWNVSLGILFFSGSLYALALTKVKMLGAMTPIGGLMFIVGWICLAGWALKS